MVYVVVSLLCIHHNNKVNTNFLIVLSWCRVTRVESGVTRVESNYRGELLCRDVMIVVIGDRGVIGRYIDLDPCRYDGIFFSG